MPFAAIIGPVLAAAPQLPSALGILSQHPKDPERFAEAQSFYSAAVQGDQQALCALKFMSGRYGVSGGNCKGSGRSGYATQSAKDYAHKLYEQALGVLQGDLPQNAPTPLSPTEVKGGKVQGAIDSVAGALSKTSSATGYVAGKLGQPNVQEQQRNAAIIIGGVLLVLGVATTIYFVRR